MKVYCDTCVYIDALQGRRNKYRPLDEFAWNFFNKVTQGKYILVTSDHVLKEFKKIIQNDKDILGLLDQIKKEQKIHIFTTKKDVIEAQKLSTHNKADALHVVLAKKAGALILTTRNIKDFDAFGDVIEISLPERL